MGGPGWEVGAGGTPGRLGAGWKGLHQVYVCSFLTHPALFSVYPACLPAFLLLQGLLWALGHALTTLKSHREDFRAMQRRGMERDASWDLAAQQYEQVFEWALVSGRGREGEISTLCALQESQFIPISEVLYE